MLSKERMGKEIDPITTPVWSSFVNFFNGSATWLIRFAGIPVSEVSARSWLCTLVRKFKRKIQSKWRPRRISLDVARNVEDGTNKENKSEKKVGEKKEAAISSEDGER